MPLTPREAFKVGFLARCVEDGLGPEEISARVKLARDLMEKHASTEAAAAKGAAGIAASGGASILGKLLGKGIDVGTGLGKGLLQYGVPLALAAPPIVGGAAGYGLARATDLDDMDVADVKEREIIDEYRRQSEKLKRRLAVRDYLKSRQQPGRLYM